MASSRTTTTSPAATGGAVSREHRADLGGDRRVLGGERVDGVRSRRSPARIVRCRPSGPLGHLDVQGEVLREPDQGVPHPLAPLLGPPDGGSRELRPRGPAASRAAPHAAGARLRARVRCAPWRPWDLLRAVGAGPHRRARRPDPATGRTDDRAGRGSDRHADGVARRGGQRRGELGDAVAHQARGDPDVRAARTDEERRARRDTDPLAGQPDDGGGLVGDGDPDVDAVRPADVDAVAGEGVDQGARGVRRRPSRARSTDARDRSSVSSSSSSRCSSRLDQPWPSCRSAVIRRAMSAGAPTAASRRSGPCDLAKLRTCTVRSGSHCPRLTSGVVAIAPAESSSSTGGGAEPQHLGQLRGAVAGEGHAGRVLRPRLQDERPDRTCRAQALDGSARSRPPAPATISAPRDSSRSSSGGNAGCSTATRSPKPIRTRAARSSPSIAPSTTSRSSGWYGQSARRCAASSGSTGSSR